MKEKCAEKAFELIKAGMTVGLGGGSTVSLLIEKIAKEGLSIQVVTPSQDTMNLCMENHIPLLPLEGVSHVDIAFDGCDELDRELNALKSCGGIHTREKIVAALSDDYVLLADEEKLSPVLTFRFPVAVEVIRSAKGYVKRELRKLGAAVSERNGAGKTGTMVSDDGNYLLEAVFDHVENAPELSARLKGIPGIVETSLFCGLAAKAIIAKKDGIEIIERSRK